MTKKAVLGGTFDPIHNGHMYIAYEALNKLALDKLVFMPAGNPPHKLNRKVTDAKIRYDMVKLAIQNEKRFELDDYEVKKNGFSYTFETLEYLNSKEKNTQWYFISGADCLFEIESWKNAKEILELSKLVVFSRAGYLDSEIIKKKLYIEEKYNQGIVFLELPLIDISSSMIRKNIGEGDRISDLVPSSILKYINDKNLYKK